MAALTRTFEPALEGARADVGRAHAETMGKTTGGIIRATLREIDIDRSVREDQAVSA